MRFNVTAVPAAILAALCLSIPFVAHADGASNQPSVAIQSVCGEGDHLFNITNNSATSTTSVLRYKLTARASEYIRTPFMTWNLMLFPLAPGQVFRLTVPRAAWGLKLSLEVYSDAAATQVIATSGTKAVSFPNFCW